MDNLWEAIDKKIKLHLSLNNMTDLELIDFNSPTPLEDKNYFFYKIDGLDNFSRGINNYSIFTGIIVNGQIFCFTCLIPSLELMVWYQEEDPVLYSNNVVKWSKNMSRRAYRDMTLIGLSIKNYKDFQWGDNLYTSYNNFSYNFFLLMNDSINKWIVESPTPGEQFLLNQWNAMEMTENLVQNDYTILNKKYYEHKE